ncbi:uncharacterized protein LOC141890330 isoform X1 [Acropora palmata]|uniref:uncharacterized protein LOC141890330 isoform X1 n=1 Tax=Acropora palmata TaxID=6131 RepID=UPI003D9FD108
MAHILSACPALAQTKYLARHDAVLKVLFFDIMEDLGLIEASPPWYSPTKPQPVYEGAYAQAYWDVPVFGEYQDLRANRIDARIVNHQEKKVITMEMSCPWVSNRQKKTSEKTMKYAPLRWELKQKYPGYKISQYNIIVDVLGGWSTDVEVAVKELVGRRHKDVLKKMQAHALIRQYFQEILSDECVSTKLGVTENFVSSLYLPLIQSSTLKSVLSTVFTALATLLHLYIYIYIF